MSSPPEQAPKSKRLLFILLAVGVVVALGIGGKPAYRSLRYMRANYFAGEAENLIRESRFTEARARMASSVQLAPDNPNLIRRLAYVATSVGFPEAQDLWKILVASGQATDQDRVMYAKVAIARENLDLAQAVADELAVRSPGVIEAYLIQAEVAERLRTPDVAQEALRKGLANNPENPVLSNALARLIARYPDPGLQKEAIALLEKTSRLATPDGRDALIMLLQSPVPASSQIEAMEKLRSHQNRTEEDELLLLMTEMKQHPDRKDALVKEALGRYKNASPEAKAIFARWLNRNRMHAMVPELFDLKEALSRKDFFLIYADALAALGKWQDLNEIFRDQTVPLDATYALIFRARIAQELGDEATASIYWRQAEAAAATSEKPRETLLYLAGYAEMSRRPELALKALRKLAENPITAPEGFRKLVQFQERTGSTRQIRDTVMEMLNELPESLEARNDLAYLNLLLNEHVEQSRQMASGLVDRFPNFLAYRTTLALASLRLGDAKSAASLIADMPVDWRQAQPGWQAVRAAALGGSGRVEEAREAVKGIELKRLKPEEHNLIVPYL